MRGDGWRRTVTERRAGPAAQCVSQSSAGLHVAAKTARSSAPMTRYDNAKASCRSGELVLYILDPATTAL